MTLHVRITRRDKTTRALEARIIQKSADTEIAGSNLLQGHCITRIETAKEHVRRTLPRHSYAHLEFEILASPDLEQPYRLGYDRSAVRREVQS